ncbi:hypothetical protein E4U09_001554 [Claviceps aff. purpurea]|uniref:DUF7702 domain-containing protein n=1 Tax=Claviceps aff. purpurea TaxID=1967640 RepID=A0A9P7QQ84_9HYPO|nr:hypothetical protein E4U09_001554 [Claviceps aff. purpurea]
MPYLDAYDIISIVGIPIYVILLACAIILCLKHGFYKSAGWPFLALLALWRIVSFSIRLALVNDPTNTSLWAGWLILNSVGLGPLLLLLLSLLLRVFESINRQGFVVLKPLYQRLIQILVLVAVICGIVGGTNSSYNIVDDAIMAEYTTLTRVGVGLMIAAIALLCGEAFIAVRGQGYIAQGEHRILLGVVASIPFVIARLVYSCLTVFGGVTPNVWLYLFLSILTELVVMSMLEVLGFMLEKAPRRMEGDADPEMLVNRREQRQHH